MISRLKKYVREKVQIRGRSLTVVFITVCKITKLGFVGTGERTAGAQDGGANFHPN